MGCVGEVSAPERKCDARQAGEFEFHTPPLLSPSLRQEPARLRKDNRGTYYMLTIAPA